MDKTISELLVRLDVLEAENARLAARVMELEERLAKYENPKNSGNSGIPPSEDPFRKIKSLRGRSKRPRGGQKGHKGNKLKMVADPDTFMEHDLPHCCGCGHRLTGKAEWYDAR